MGFFDFLKKTVICPECRTQNAQKYLGAISCPNPQCPRYDAKLNAAPAALSTAEPLPAPSGDFDPGANAIKILYRNFQGFDREFVGDRQSLRLSGNHYSVKVAPTGRRIQFDRRFIANLDKVEAAIQAAPPEPKGRDRQVLAYHLKHGTTSPLFEKVRTQFPNWRP